MITADEVVSSAVETVMDESSEGVVITWKLLKKYMKQQKEYSLDIFPTRQRKEIETFIDNISMYLMNDEKYKDNIKIAEEILAMEWEDESLYYRTKIDMAICYERLGEIEYAKDLFQDYLEEEPLNSWYWIHYYRLLERQYPDEYEEVIDMLYHQLLEGKEFDFEEVLYEDLGLIFEERNDTIRQEEMIRQRAIARRKEVIQVQKQHEEDGQKIKEAIIAYQNEPTKYYFALLADVLKKNDLLVCHRLIFSDDLKTKLENMIKHANHQEDNFMEVQLETLQQLEFEPEVLEIDDELYLPVFTSTNEIVGHLDNVSLAPQDIYEIFAIAANHENEYRGIVVNGFSDSWKLNVEDFHMIDEIIIEN